LYHLMLQRLLIPHGASSQIITLHFCSSFALEEFFLMLILFAQIQRQFECKVCCSSSF
jgi:hypothetical protein